MECRTSLLKETLTTVPLSSVTAAAAGQSSHNSYSTATGRGNDVNSNSHSHSNSASWASSTMQPTYYSNSHSYAYPHRRPYPATSLSYGSFTAARSGRRPVAPSVIRSHAEGAGGGGGAGSSPSSSLSRTSSPPSSPTGSASATGYSFSSWGGTVAPDPNSHRSHHNSHNPSYYNYSNHNNNNGGSMRDHNPHPNHRHSVVPGSLSSNATVTTVTRERIPLPKNVVLLSLIESSQLLQDTAQHQLISKGLNDLSSYPRKSTQSSSLATSGILSTFQQDGVRDDDKEEEDRITLGADIVNAACGTYAVANKNGLKIVPKRKDLEGNSEQEHVKEKISFKAAAAADDDDDGGGKTLTLRDYAAAAENEYGVNDSLWKRNVEEIVVNNVKKKIKPYNQKDKNDELTLNYGDRIQVVGIVGKWAKLARGYGYVYLENETDIVKVGGVLDKAANIEAMIYSLSYCRGKLLEAQTSTEREAISLLKELQMTLVQEKDVTVIGAEAFIKGKKKTTVENNNDDDIRQAESFSSDQDQQKQQAQQDDDEMKEEGHSLDGSDNRSSNDHSSGPGGGGMQDVYRPRNHGNNVNVSSHKKESGTVHHDNKENEGIQEDRSRAVSPASFYSSLRHERHYQKQQHDTATDANSSRSGHPNNSFLNFALCGLKSMVSGEDEEERDDLMASRSRNSGLRLQASSSTLHSHYSTDYMVRAAQEWRRRNGKEASEYTHIDFRTGMSGHQGFLSSHAHDRQHTSSSWKLRMSAHSALTPKRTRKKSLSNSSFSFSFG